MRLGLAPNSARVALKHGGDDDAPRSSSAGAGAGAASPEAGSASSKSLLTGSEVVAVPGAARRASAPIAGVGLPVMTEAAMACSDIRGRVAGRSSEKSSERLADDIAAGFLFVQLIGKSGWLRVDGGGGSRVKGGQKKGVKRSSFRARVQPQGVGKGDGGGGGSCGKGAGRVYRKTKCSRGQGRAGAEAPRL
jgi:hypothetical protein